MKICVLTNVVEGLTVHFSLLSVAGGIRNVCGSVALGTGPSQGWSVTRSVALKSKP